ncbi:MAG: UvrD-helicase domain-containing protein [Bacteroidales bacterium]|nr:UvrD-helicase domain-containing protein [Bacteroidales bacterium]
MDNNVRAIFEALNEEQREAVASLDGPSLIIAGAGSGKTRVLTSRIANLLDHGCEPSRVLALTFTKKAAGEMKDRIASMVGSYKARRLVMGTFHSVFIRFLRNYAELLGYPADFTIYDQSDSVSAVKAVIKEMELDDAVYKPKEVLSRISSAKNSLVTVSAYKADRNLQQGDLRRKQPRLADVYARYQAKMKMSGVMDFDDILVNMNQLLRGFPDACAEISGRFTHILVDEYQDTNYAQYLIIKTLAAPHRNICVVGDDSQSNYAFRGAQIQNILNFKKDYPDCRFFRLERNYRSTRTIVDAANSIIEHNAGRIPKKCYSESAEGEKIHVIKAYSEQEEAVEIVSGIQSRMRKDAASYRDFAILYRTNSQSRVLEEQLRRRNIPYRVYSGNSFFERAEVKDLMAYFKLAVNPFDDESFKCTVNKPARGIGDTSLKALEALALSRSVPLYKAACLEDAVEFGLRPAAMLKIRAFCEMIGGFSKEVPGTGAFVLARSIAEKSGLYAFYQSDLSIEGQARFANVEELINSVASFEEEREEEVEEAGGDPSAQVFTLPEFLENVALLSNVDASEEREEDGDNKVALMTVHSAKGLEFPHVFVAGMEDNLFPGQTALSNPAELEEERRLFYVAVTRACRTVTLSYAVTRMRNGRHESYPVSRFLREIDPKYLDSRIGREVPGASSFGREASFGGSFAGRPAAAYGAGRVPSEGRFQNGGRGVSGGPLQEGYGRPGGFFAGGASKSPAGGGTTRFPASGGMRSSGSSSVLPSRVSSAASSDNPLLPADPNFVASPMTDFKTGMRVEHNRFGFGEILEITGKVPELKARVKFDLFGEKLLLLKYAKMRPEKR